MSFVPTVSQDNINKQISMSDWGKDIVKSGSIDSNIPTNILDKYIHKPMKIYVYPESLDNDEYAHSFMKFTIKGDSDVTLEKNNIFGNGRVNGSGQEVMSKAGKSAADLIETVSGISQDDMLSSLKKNFTTSTDMASDVYNNGWSGIKKYVGDAIPLTIEAMRNFDGSAIGVSDRVDTILAQIILPIPEKGFSTNYGVQYTSEAMGLGGALVDAALSGQSLSEILKSSKSAAAAIGSDVIAGIAGEVTGGNKTFINPEGTIQALRRSVFNPRKEQLFKSVSLREFTYHHVYAPSSRAECEMVKNIITLFKYHMLPSLTNQGLYLKYPSEFQIEYIFNNQTNDFVNAIAECALINFNIQYGSGSWSTLVNGSPTIIHTSMTFQELMPLTRDMLNERGL